MFIHNPIGLELLTRLRLALSHLSNDKVNQNFMHCINPLCSCSLIVENNVQRQTVMNNIKSIDKDIINETDSELVNTLLFGSSK